MSDEQLLFLGLHHYTLDSSDNSLTFINLSPPSFHRPRTPSSYSVIAIKAKCVCQALFQRVTHRMSSKQVSTAGGHRRTIELCPTKLSMETSGYPAWPAGRTCSVNQNRLLLYQKARLVRLQVVHECSEKYLLLTHRFAVFTHAWTSAFSSHIEASFYHTSVCLSKPLLEPKDVCFWECAWNWLIWASSSQQNRKHATMHTGNKSNGQWTQNMEIVSGRKVTSLHCSLTRALIACKAPPSFSPSMGFKCNSQQPRGNSWMEKRTQNPKNIYQLTILPTYNESKPSRDKPQSKEFIDRWIHRIL